MNDNEKDKISSLMTQIEEQLVRNSFWRILTSRVFFSLQQSIRQENIQLTEQLTNLYSDLCHIRQILADTHSTSHLNTTSLIEPSTSNRYHSKQRSDSEPNILTDRQRILTIIDHLQ